MTAIFKEATPPIPQRSDGRIFDAASLAKAEAEKRLRQLVTKYRSSAPKLAAWLEENLPEGFAVFSQPEAQRRRLRTSNACENLYRQVRRRTAVAGLFPNEASLLRLVSAILMEISGDWETSKCYLSLPKTTRSR
jgi:transposase-like protein